MNCRGRWWLSLLSFVVACGSASTPVRTTPPSGDSSGAPAAGAALHGLVDRDADTVLADDRCPDDAEDLDGFEDADGCYDADNDADQRVDADDLCPDAPEDVDSFEDEDGCPDPDNDQDRIADLDDRCPNEPETYNGQADDDGCPDRGLVVVTSHPPASRESLYFAPRSARLSPLQRPLLAAIAATLQHNPQIERVALVARTAQGESPRIASQRAIAVRDALVARGVVPARLETLSLDRQSPLGSKDLDRSVEIFVVRVNGQDVENLLLGTARVVR